MTLVKIFYKKNITDTGCTKNISIQKKVLTEEVMLFVRCGHIKD